MGSVLSRGGLCSWVAWSFCEECGFVSRVDVSSSYKTGFWCPSCSETPHDPSTSLNFSTVSKNLHRWDLNIPVGMHLGQTLSCSRLPHSHPVLIHSCRCGGKWCPCFLIRVPQVFCSRKEILMVKWKSVKKTHIPLYSNRCWIGLHWLFYLIIPLELHNDIALRPYSSWVPNLPHAILGGPGQIRHTGSSGWCKERGWVGYWQKTMMLVCLFL